LGSRPRLNLSKSSLVGIEAAEEEAGVDEGHLDVISCRCICRGPERWVRPSANS
jgi:hypothetical protein